MGRQLLTHFIWKTKTYGTFWVSYLSIIWIVVKAWMLLGLSESQITFSAQVKMLISCCCGAHAQYTWYEETEKETPLQADLMSWAAHDQTRKLSSWWLHSYHKAMEAWVRKCSTTTTQHVLLYFIFCFLFKKVTDYMRNKINDEPYKHFMTLWHVCWILLRFYW